MSREIKQGDFTQMAKSYINRVGYSELVLNNLVRYIKLNENFIVADVGAGTGKLTENLLPFGMKNIYAIEPNDSMRQEGEKYIQDARVEWKNGSGENTGLDAESVDWVTMGSSFHWVNTELGLKEFSRILKPNGYFTAIWNPRDIKGNKLYEEIENKIYEIAPHIKRVSSGSGKFTEDLFEKMISTDEFCDVIYVEAKHQEVMSRERYMGIWHSVNDIQSQAGPDKWKLILDSIEQIISKYDQIVVPYKSRSWTARKK